MLASDQEAALPPVRDRRASTSSTASAGEPGPLGSPILDGAVSWIECTFEDIREAGDHYIVLGRVHELAVERSTLPLLFFQGGYGRFSPGSFVAAPDPELIQAAQLAETIRRQVEQLSVEFGVNCSVLAKIRWDAVQVLAANPSPVAEPFPLGHRQPLVPPFGAVFMANASEADVDEWLRRAPDDSEERRELNRRSARQGARARLLAAHRQAGGDRSGTRRCCPRSSSPTGCRGTSASCGRPPPSWPTSSLPTSSPAKTYDLANIVVSWPRRDRPARRWPSG